MLEVFVLSLVDRKASNDRSFGVEQQPSNAGFCSGREDHGQVVFAWEFVWRHADIDEARTFARVGVDREVILKPVVRRPRRRTLASVSWRPSFPPPTSAYRLLSRGPAE